MRKRLRKKRMKAGVDTVYNHVLSNIKLLQYPRHVRHNDDRPMPYMVEPTNKNNIDETIIMKGCSIPFTCI